MQTGFIFQTGDVTSKILERSDDYPFIVVILFGGIVLFGTVIFFLAKKFFKSWDESNSKRDEFADFIRKEIPKLSGDIHSIEAKIKGIEADFTEVTKELRPELQGIRDRLESMDKRILLIEERIRSK